MGWRAHSFTRVARDVTLGCHTKPLGKWRRDSLETKDEDALYFLYLGVHERKSFCSDLYACTIRVGLNSCKYLFTLA